MRILSLTQEGAGLLPVHDRPIDRRDVGDTMAEVTLKLVHVVRALPATARILRVDGINTQPARAHAEYEGILRAHGTVVLGVALHGEVQHRLLVFMLKESEHNERETRILYSLLWNVSQVQCYSRSDL